MQKKGTTLIIGASENPERYSNKAANVLVNKGYPIKLLGKVKGKIGNIPIATGFPKVKNIDTVTLYLNQGNQVPYYQYIIDLKPRRVIFNPGAENPEFQNLLNAHNIANEEACTLVLLSLNAY